MRTTFMSMTPIPQLGGIWLVNFDPAVGAEIRKLRPAVVLSSHKMGRLPLRVVAPITEWKSHYVQYSWFVHIPPSNGNGLNKESGADAFQVKSVSDKRFAQLIG